MDGEYIIQKLEIIGLTIGRSIKKNKAHEYIMSRGYSITALDAVRELIKEVRAREDVNLKSREGIDGT